MRGWGWDMHGAVGGVEVLSAGRVCLEAGCTIGRLKYAIRTGDLPEPSRLGYVRVWTRSEAEQVKAYFRELARSEKAREGRPPKKLRFPPPATPPVIFEPAGTVA